MKEKMQTMMLDKMLKNSESKKDVEMQKCNDKQRIARGH